MSKEKPDHWDADLTLKLYDLRRESVMRRSRDALSRQFWPKSYEDVQAVLDWEHPLNAAFRQVSTYWEMVYGMARHGIVHADYLVETNGEGLVLYLKLEPYLERLRQDFSPTFLQNSQWAAERTAAGQAFVNRMKPRLQKLAESR